MKLLSKTDAISAVSNWKYWYCYECEEVFLRTDSDRDFGRWQTICPKCHTSRCDPCVWVLHCHKEQLGSTVPEQVKSSCENCEARFNCWSRRMV